MNTYRDYYLVVKYFNDYPMFITCCNKAGQFYKIENLEQYLVDEIGVTEELIEYDEKNTNFILIKDKQNWKHQLNML